MMNDKMLVNIIKAINDNCNKKSCGDCEFYQIENYKPHSRNCQIMELTKKLDEVPPRDWELEEIEEIIKG